MTDRQPSSWPLSVVALGLLIGLALGLVGGWALRTKPPAIDDLQGVVVPDPVDVEAFVAAWERSRRGTFLVISEFHRENDLGDEMRLTQVLVQRPPDRVQSSGMSITGSVGGVRYVCDDLPDDVFECREIPVETDFDASIEREVSALWTYVLGQVPLYRVSRDGDCFDLTITRRILAPPYGNSARFCFDPDSGAVVEIRIERDEVTDTVRAISITTDVSDDDLISVATRVFDVADHLRSN
jgi:hypothetical protein